MAHRKKRNRLESLEKRAAALDKSFAQVLLAQPKPGKLATGGRKT